MVRQACAAEQPTQRILQVLNIHCSSPVSARRASLPCSWELKADTCVMFASICRSLQFICVSRTCITIMLLRAQCRARHCMSAVVTCASRMCISVMLLRVGFKALCQIWHCSLNVVHLCQQNAHQRHSAGASTLSWLCWRLAGSLCCPGPLPHLQCH